MTALTPTSPARPTLEQQPGKPDIVERLKARRDWWANSEISEADDALSAVMDRTHGNDMADAITTIEGLRAANLRHCEDERLLKDARARCAELERVVRQLRDALNSNAGTVADMAEMIDPDDGDEENEPSDLWAACDSCDGDDFCSRRACRENGCVHMRLSSAAAAIAMAEIALPDQPAPLPDAPQTGEAGR